MLEHDRIHSGLRKAWSLGYYIPKSGNQDRFSNDILRFKNGYEESLQFYSRLSTYYLLQQPIFFDGIIRPLGSSELVADGSKPLDYLGKFLSAHLVTHSGEFTQYCPHLIRKNKITTPLHLTRSRNDRIQSLSGVYESNNLHYDFIMPYKGFETISPKILIIDDVITTGTTMAELCKLLNEEFISPILYGFTLATTFNSEVSSNFLLQNSYYDDLVMDKVNHFFDVYRQNFVNYK